MRQLGGTDGLLRIRDREHLGVAGDVAVARRARGGFGHDAVAVADDAGERVLAPARRLPRQLDAAPEHLRVEGLVGRARVHECGPIRGAAATA